MRRENAEAWLFEIVDRIAHNAATYSASYAGLTRVSIIFARIFSKGWIAGSSRQ
jgi:hypothetical protein